MSILGKFYDYETKTDRVWYDSSNVFYSKFIENENDNKGTLYVTFKNGWTYKYKDVDMPTDYLLFKNGGIENSQGKTFNKFIKPKYEYERVNDEDISLLQEEYNRLFLTKEEEEPFTIEIKDDKLTVNGQEESVMTEEDRGMCFQHIMKKLPDIDDGWFSLFLRWFCQTYGNEKTDENGTTNSVVI